MKVSPIRNYSTNSGINEEKTSFKGKMETYYGGRPYFPALKDFHSNSSVEENLGKYHSNKTGKIYFADPMEPVSNELKHEADYIVYDNEPAYPDVNNEISKNYFGTERVNYREQFENIRDYFYRREQAGWADKAEAQYQQWQAAECINLYDKAGDLRYQKETLEDEVSNANDKIKQTENSISLTKDLITEKEAVLKSIEQKIPDLEAKENAYKTFKSEIDKDNGLNTEAEKDFVAIGLASVTAILANNKELLASLQGKIENLKIRLGRLEGNLAGYENVVKTNTPKIEEVKAKLIPLFDELKHFYQRQGIKKF